MTSSSVTGAGTAYSLTNALAVVTFGTTSPSLSLAAGTWLLFASLAFSGGTVADNLQGQLWNSTDSAIIGSVHNETANLAVGTNITEMQMQATVVLAGTKTITVEAQNATGARGTIVAANSYLVAVKIA